VGGVVVTGGVAGVTVQSAFIVAPLGVVDEVTGAVGVGACVCSACGVTLVPTAGLSPDAICDCTFALLAAS